MNLMEMKKYLITAALAVVVSGSFIGCKDEEFNGSRMEQKVEAFEEAFIRAFGQPDPNHTWGFENLDGENLNGTDFAMTRGALTDSTGANKNRNLWAATDNVFNLLVPTPLTEGQKNRVRAYFQTHRYLTWEQPDMTSYFVQQVYTGGTNTTGSLSSEVYTSGNGASVTGGQHMDYLTIGDNNEHVLDFNGANNVNTATDVKNNGTLTNDTQYHSDQITLMIGVPPTNVGYKESDGSVQHIDCMALADAKTIDDWARAQDPVIGEDVWYGKDQYGYDNSFWERSFVGLDYEKMSPEECFTEKYFWPEGNRSTVKVWDFCSDTNNTHKVKLNGQLVDASTVANDQLFFPNGEPVRWVKDQTNMYLGQNLGTTQNTFNKEENGVKYYDLDAVYACIKQGAYPKENNMEFIKGLGGRDYVYSDWIVTLAPAKENVPTPDAPQVYIVSTDTQKQKIEVYKSKQVSQAGRVMCEDLANYADLDDFDYNDIVFDVIIVRETTTTITTPLDGNNQPNGDPVTTTSEDYYANVRLMAAGGTIPAEIKIGSYGYYVVHDVLGKKPTDTMINTLSEGERAKVRGAAVDSVAPVDLTHGNGYKDFYGIRKISDIEVYVKYGNDATRLTPIKGKPSPIFVVPLNTLWAKERSNIADAYKSFNNWVGEEDYAFWSGDRDMNELYQKYQSDGFQKGKDYWILEPRLEEGYPEISVISSTTTPQLVNATNNTMVIPGNGETKLLDYDPQNPGYLCKSTSTSDAMDVSVPGYSNVNVGDILRIYGVSRTGWLIRTNLPSNTCNAYTSDGYIDITITAGMLDKVKAGFTISGELFTVTYVTVRTPNQ